MASHDDRTSTEEHANVAYHLQKIREIIPSYIGENREERDIHLTTVAEYLNQYECDLKSANALDGSREEFAKMLNESLTELMGYFRFKFVDDDQGEYIDESIAVIFAYFLEKGTLELRDLAQSLDNDTE